MYNQAAVQELPNQAERALLRSYLNCAQFTYFFYGVFQAIFMIFLIFEGGTSATGIFVVAILVIIAGVRIQDSKNKLRQRIFNQRKLRSELSFSFCLNNIVVLANIALWSLLGILLYFLFEGTSDMKEGMIIYGCFMLGILLILSPFFVLMVKTGAAKQAMEVVCDPANGLGIGSITAQGASQPVVYHVPLPTQMNNQHHHHHHHQQVNGHQTGPHHAKPAPVHHYNHHHSPC